MIALAVPKRSPAAIPPRRTPVPALLLLVPALSLSLAALPARSQADRYFQPTDGFVLAKDLPADFSATVRSIQLVIKDVMEGSTVHSEAEAATFEIINKLHIESRPGTIRRRLLFKEGEVVTAGLLEETEKALRSEPFLADAYIEVRSWEDGSAHIIVTTYDQWTTTLAFTPQFLGDEFFYQAGVVESNLFGTGQRLGFFLSQGRERDTRMVEYANNALTPWRLRLASHFAWLSDEDDSDNKGYSTLVGLSKPLESRADRWSFGFNWTAKEVSEYVYFDANQLETFPDSLADRLDGGSRILSKFNRVATHEVGASVTRSYGRRTKFNVSPMVDWKDRYNHGSIQTSGLTALLPPDPTALRPEERYDILAGFMVSLYQYDYKIVHNYRNLKWSETLDVGWRLTTKVSLNQEWLGADNGDFYLSHGAVYNNAWRDAWFINSGANLRYFVSPGGEFDNGYGSLNAEVQWKPVTATTTYLSGSFGSYFASEGTYQALLGEDTGLLGYPNAYYAGQAFVLLEAEQRYFPRFEFGTLVPAFAVFGNAGNTFPHYDDVDFGDLHYSLGLGLRLGFSKTVQKLVYHINLSQPIGEERLDGPSFSFRVKLGL